MTSFNTCPPTVVSLAIQGDRSAFAEIYAAHRGSVFGAAYRVLRDSEDAEDIVQETFARALAAIADYDERAPIGAWLCRIARNAAIDELRARGRRPVDGIPHSHHYQGHDIEAADARLDADLATRQVMKRAPIAWRHVMVLKFGGATNAEIAAALGRPESAVKALYYRCLTALQEAAL